MRIHEIVGPEVTQVTGQLRIPKGEAIAKHLAQFWIPGFDTEPKKPLTERGQRIRDKQNEIWRAQNARREARTGIEQMEKDLQTLAEGGRVPVVRRAEWYWRKDSTIQVDRDGNLYETRMAEYVKPRGSSEWQIVTK